MAVLLMRVLAYGAVIDFVIGIVVPALTRWANVWRTSGASEESGSLVAALLGMTNKGRLFGTAEAVPSRKPNPARLTDMAGAGRRRALQNR